MTIIAALGLFRNQHGDEDLATPDDTVEFCSDGAPDEFDDSKDALKKEDLGDDLALF